MEKRLYHTEKAFGPAQPLKTLVLEMYCLTESFNMVLSVRLNLCMASAASYILPCYPIQLTSNDIHIVQVHNQVVTGIAMQSTFSESESKSSSTNVFVKSFLAALYPRPGSSFIMRVSSVSPASYMPPGNPCLPCASPCIFSLTLTLTSKNLDTQRSRQTDSPLFRSASRYAVSTHFAEQDLRRLWLRLSARMDNCTHAW